MVIIRQKNNMESSWQGHVPTKTEIQHMSKYMFRCMCHTVGASSVVAMRRDISDIVEIHNHQLDEIYNTRYVQMESGSIIEGFRLYGSDVDLMIWSNEYQVIWDSSQAMYNYSSSFTQILADCSESPPGFALLQLPIPSADIIVLTACIRMNNKIYISSSIYKEMIYLAFGPDNKIHGPCVSGMSGQAECDYAYCFFSNYWPPSALSWIDRSYIYHWPPCHVVTDIVKGGCHLVAIGHTLGNHTDKEWRISFSLAEKKLVYAMNHCQFLTYGLLKIFFKEVINNTTEDNKLLCSYHVKTAMFWVIQNNAMSYFCPQNFLDGFWMCFKHVIKWVYKGSCPNFFIPENNMFLTNIYGAAQKNLFYRLYALYEKGFSCLLQSPTILSHIMFFLLNPRLEICTNEKTFITECEFDNQLFSEVFLNQTMHIPNLQDGVNALHSIEHLICFPLKQCQVLMLQAYYVSHLQKMAFVIQRRYSDFLSKSLRSNLDRKVNKFTYKADKLSLHMLHFAAKFGCISDMLFVVMYFYKKRRYIEALTVLKMAKFKLIRSYRYFISTVDTRTYIVATGVYSWTKKKREYSARYITLYNEIPYINEFMIEQHYSLQNNVPCLDVPPLVLSYMLGFLCYKHIDTRSSLEALKNLELLDQKDQIPELPIQKGPRIFIDDDGREIAWQILGICKEISGNHLGAFYAYLQSLTVHPYHKFQQATLIRILIAIFIESQRRNKQCFK